MLTLTSTRPAATTPMGPASPAAMGSRKSGFYRHDLDGLRGVAIALVAVFHVWFGRVSGGVDVFLVLSGFFFGGSLLRTALNPESSLSPWPEIVRLVRRLLPALVVVLAAGAVLTILVQPETRWETFADQSLASLGYYQNWELSATASNYLRAGEAVSPLQHIWSMSVQGQFYIAFLAACLPVCLRAAPSARHAAARHFRGFADRADGGVVRLCRRSPIRPTRPPPTTTASPAPGSCCWALWSARWCPTSPGRCGCAPCWPRVGLAAIVSCGALIDGVRQFPGPWALVPVGAAVLMILAAANRQAHPSTRDRLPLAQPAAGRGPAGDAGVDGLLAVSVALAAADLLAGLHRRGARRPARRRRDPGGLRRAGLPDDAVRRGAAALPAPGGRGAPAAGRGAVAHPAGGARRSRWAPPWACSGWR